MAGTCPTAGVKIWDASGMVVVKCFGILIEGYGEGPYGSGDRRNVVIGKASAMENIRAAGRDRSEALQGQIVEERYDYYRRCQRFRRNGQQCKAPAMKDTDRCYKHQEQADIERRRRAQFTLPPLVDLKTIQREIGKVAQALIQDRIDEDYAGELLQKLERASIALRPRSASR